MRSRLEGARGAIWRETSAKTPSVQKPRRAALEGGRSPERPHADDPLALCEPPSDEAREVNMDYAATTPMLRSVLEAVTSFAPWYASVHRGGGARSRVASEAFERSRQTIERFIDCPAGSSVVFVRNTTEAANVLASALPPDSRILCSPVEHHANLLPWRSHETTYLPFTPTLADFVALVEATLDAAAARGAPYRLLAVTGASNVTGEVMPIRRLAEVAHRFGALIFVDAAQLAPHRPIALRELDADFLAFSGHKLYAPFGTGALAIREDAVRHGLPLLKGGGAVRLVSFDSVAWADPPRRYEAGTPNLLGAVALAAACETLQAAGMDVVARREQALAERLWAGLERIEALRHLRLWDDVDDRVGVAAFTVGDIPAHEVGRELAERYGIAVRTGGFCAHPLVAHLLGVDQAAVVTLFERISAGETVEVPGAVRASIGLGTSTSDVDALTDAVAAIAP
jgi:selenocysteine lyase/cysteine desulfurase